MKWFWHVAYVELVRVELIILGCVVPDKSSKVYWVVCFVPAVEHGDGRAFIESVAHGDGLPGMQVCSFHCSLCPGRRDARERGWIVGCVLFDVERGW